MFAAIVQALVPLNRHLRIVEGIVLHPKVIADAYSAALHWSDTTTLAYTVKLALVNAARPGVSFVSGGGSIGPATTMSIRSHHPDDLGLGLQFTPQDVSRLSMLFCGILYPSHSLCWCIQVTTPLNLSRIGVRQMEMCDMSGFTRVQFLNLSQNRLTTLFGFGLEKMASLVQLDVHDNLLQ